MPSTPNLRQRALPAGAIRCSHCASVAQGSQSVAKRGAQTYVRSPVDAAAWTQVQSALGQVSRHATVQVLPNCVSMHQCELQSALPAQGQPQPPGSVQGFAPALAPSPPPLVSSSAGASSPVTASGCATAVSKPLVSAPMAVSKTMPGPTSPSPPVAPVGVGPVSPEQAAVSISAARQPRCTTVGANHASPAAASRLRPLRRLEAGPGLLFAIALPPTSRPSGQPIPAGYQARGRWAKAAWSLEGGQPSLDPPRQLKHAAGGCCGLRSVSCRGIARPPAATPCPSTRSNDPTPRCRTPGPPRRCDRAPAAGRSRCRLQNRTRTSR